MRIGIDARKMFDGGIGTYIRALIGALVAREDGNRYVVLTGPEDHGRVLWPPESVDEVLVNAGKYGIAEHFSVAAAAAGAKVRLLHAPHYTLPMGWLGRSVVTIHDLIHIRFPQFHPPGAATYARTVAGMAAFKSRLVLVDSSWGRREVMELLGVPERKIRVIPLAPTPGLGPASPERVKAYQDERKLPRDYLLYVGARKAHKNVGLLLEAMGRMGPGDRPPLVISGPRWAPDDPFAKRCAALGLEPWLYFAGNPATVEELGMLYSGAMVYLQPSLSEGFGLPPLEAMACGVPVIASDVAALPETLGDAALLVPPHGPEAWAAAITQLVRDTWARTQLAVAGRAHAATFSWERTADQTMAAYLEAVS